jgi:hypothetical protein
LSVDRVSRYIISNGEQFVKNQNATSLTTVSDDAYMWTLKTSAENVLSDAKNRSSNSPHATIDNSYKVEPVYIYVSDIEPDISNDLDTIKLFADIVQDSAEREESLLAQLSKVDRELSDIEHFIEFVDLNGVDGFKIYKKMQSIRQIRREIKHRLKIVQTINSQSIDPEVLKRLVKGFGNIYYKPREVDFDGILKG